jgi:hypothetical protein
MGQHVGVRVEKISSKKLKKHYFKFALNHCLEQIKTLRLGSLQDDRRRVRQRLSV